MAAKYDHLLGLDFDMEKQNCWALIRQFYKDNYGIELTDYACPTNWWRADLDLFAKLASAEGFEILNCHPRDYREGDIIICAIQSSTGNHSAVVLDSGDILHHLVGQRSCVTSYGGMFRNTTVGVYRHREVALLKPQKHLLDVREVLPPHVRQRLEELDRAKRDLAGEAGGASDA